MKRLVLALLVGACGSDGKSSPDAANPDGPPPDAAPDAPALRSDGFIVLSEGTDDTDVDAVFAPNTPFGLATGSNGACAAYNAPIDEGYSAGTIEITGTTAPITLTPTGTAPNVSYNDGEPPQDIFAPGAAISIEASGGDVAAFTANLTAPTALAGYTPPATISRANGATLTWTAGSGTGVWVIMVAEETIVLCKVPDSGSYTLTPANLALVPPSTETPQTLFMLVGRVATADVTTANGTMSVLAIASVEGTPTLTP